MKGRRTMHMGLVAVLLMMTMTNVQSQGLMGGYKAHHHRGHGAVELLLATGILAKLFNHRNKYGQAGRHILHALIGGPRYHHPRFAQARFPLEMAMGHPGLLQDDLMDANALGSMSLPMMDNDLLLNQESSLLGVRAPMMMSPSMLDGQLLAEAQLSQQLLAARRARKLLEARKLLAANEAKNILAAQSEAVQMLAAEEAAQTSAFLAADQSRQFASSMAPPKHFIPRQVNQGNTFQHHPGQQTSMNYMGQQNSQLSQGSLNNMMASQQQQAVQGSMNNFIGSQPQPMQGSSTNFVGSQPLPSQGSLSSYLGSQTSQQMQSSPTNYIGSQSSQDMQASASSNYIRSHSMHPMHVSRARSDEVIHLPPGLSENEAAQVLANLHRMI